MPVISTGAILIDHRPLGMTPLEGFLGENQAVVARREREGPRSAVFPSSSDRDSAYADAATANGIAPGCGTREDGLPIYHAGCFDEIWLLEDNAATAERRREAGVGETNSPPQISIRLHRIDGVGSEVLAGRTYEPGSMRSRVGPRVEAAGELLRRAACRNVKPVVVAGASYGSTRAFLSVLGDLALPFVVELRPSSRIQICGERSGSCIAADMLAAGTWKDITAPAPDGVAVFYRAALLGAVELPCGTGSLFAAQLGGIGGIHKGTILAVSSFSRPVSQLVQLVAHARWMRVAARRARRRSEPASGARPSGAAAALSVRANIAVGRRHDELAQISCLEGLREPSRFEGSPAEVRTCS